MIERKKPLHAIALFSGGLDSTLAILLMLEQNVEVTALMFLNHFGCDLSNSSSFGHDPYEVAKKYGFTIKLVHLGEKFIDIVRSPKYGYGKHLNPCLDCRILMFQEARQFMEVVGADFVITGEVLGQRPKTQMRNEMNLVVRESNLKGLLLRPLSAKLFQPTIPEQQGMIDREKLEAISGRSRQCQMELADKYGLEDYPNPAAGCLLTDIGYSAKLRDLFDHQEKITFDDLDLLKIGRHFRISPTLKIVVGRNEADNDKLECYMQQYPYLEVVEHGSPISLLVGEYDESQLEVAAALTARYSDGKMCEQVEVQLTANGEMRNIKTAPLKPSQVEKYRMVWRKHGAGGKGKK